ncbi:MAG: transcriptional repressor [Firmicutes bacterium]|nr:transcriptional repressor [Bacillota bacterium]
METARKTSKKRDAILDLLRSSSEHPTAEWLYSRLKIEYPDLSLGTVYRNLSMFRKDGTITVAATVDGNERFDWNIEPHAHFICETCGKVVDVGMQGRQESVYEAIRQNTGHVVNWHSLNFFGECSDCIFTKSVRLHQD